MKTPEQYLMENNLTPEPSALATFLAFVKETETESRADECACCKALLDGIADILHNPETEWCPLKAYGLTQSTHMRAAAKVLREVATSLRVREINIREGKL